MTDVIPCGFELEAKRERFVSQFQRERWAAILRNFIQLPQASEDWWTKTTAMHRQALPH
jgi:hypothetical protein